MEKLSRLRDTYGGLMLYIARRILGPEQDAEDAVQEAFVTVCKNLSKIEEIECPKTRLYIVMITESRAIDLYRRRSRQFALPLEEAVLAADALPVCTGELGQCLLRLAPRERDLLILKHHCGYSTREAAQMLELSEAAAYKLEQRAKKRLEVLCREKGLLE